jgi:SAM-dependent methyltransferase
MVAPDTAAVLAELYDLVNPWGPSDEFYLELALAAPAVLDVGCGTGSLLHQARRSGHTGRLAGLDPDHAMLARAGRHTDIDWVLATAADAAWDQEFDLAIMASHAFQFLVTDDDLRASLTAIHAALVDGGRFAFETRNPLRREWEEWAAAEPMEVSTATGEVFRISYQVQFIGDVAYTKEITDADRWDRPQITEAGLRFCDPTTLRTFLNQAGFTIEQQFGAWDRSPLTHASPEIITIARRTPDATS